MARALPVVLVASGDVMRGRELTVLGWLGSICVVVGCLLTPLQSIRRFDVRPYLRRSTACVILAASGTTGYSLFDKAASEIVLAGPGTAARYGYMFFLLVGSVFFALQRLTTSNRQACTHIG